MEKVLKLFKIFIWNSKLKLSRCIEYRFDFIVGSIVNLVFSCVGPAFQYLIFTQTKGFPGWNLQQIILFQGVLLFVLALKSTIWGELSGYVVSLVRKGDLDRLLLKPFSSIGIIASSGFSPNNFGTLIAGIVLIVYSINNLDIQLSLFNTIMFFMFVFFGLLLFAGIYILFACATIILVNMGRLNEIIDNLIIFGQYPLEIYSKTLSTIFATVVPFAIWVNFPSRILIYGFRAYMLYGLFFSIIFVGASLKLWRLCLKHYTSGGG